MTIDSGRAVAYLEKLAAELEGRGFSVRIRDFEGLAPSLHVINLAAPILAESVLVAVDGDGECCFYFPWPERIAPVSDLLTAANRVDRVLAEVGR
ncbi:hypothetical protein [Microbispora amethystogenes]|uniref:Uncharacterized protein n=1 Tax=Microbispora amethystogenes TaxID=1427754 RepID=A0ABQ4FLI4_9ACTN|nr:hypothetical protein [Microbispora amethystogenes]GIH35679.1 hypothetical protein Mam01_58430 [Microbispora amethystogenes]